MASFQVAQPHGEHKPTIQRLKEEIAEKESNGLRIDSVTAALEAIRSHQCCKVTWSAKINFI